MSLSVVNVEKDISGTREWAVAEVNCFIGCPHDCLYCYGRMAEMRRKDRHLKEWAKGIRDDEVLIKDQPCFPGQVMFPSRHDILPENIEDCIQVLRKLRNSGNQVLVVSKPHLECISRICSEFNTKSDREKILFRFTITAREEGLLKVWEPCAPSYKERKRSLCFAYDNGFKTSVSVEPILDRGDVIAMVYELLPYISHTIWLGKMNKISERVNCSSDQIREAVDVLRRGQSDESIQTLYAQLKHIDKIRWKESIKRVVNIKLNEDAGLDM